MDRRAFLFAVVALAAPLAAAAQPALPPPPWQGPPPNAGSSAPDFPDVPPPWSAPVPSPPPIVPIPLPVPIPVTVPLPLPLPTPEAPLTQETLFLPPDPFANGLPPSPMGPPSPSPQSPPSEATFHDASPAVAAGALVAVAALGVGVFFRGDRWRWWWLALFAPLYARLAPADALQNEVREAIYHHVEEHAGIHLRALQRDLDLANGALVHHLRTLERSGFVHSVKDGRLRRFFVTGAASRYHGSPALDVVVMEYVKEHPSVTNAQVASALSKRPSVVHFHVERLVDLGRIRREKEGRAVHLYPRT